MVRTIVGTLIKIGMNDIQISDFEEIIRNKNRQNAGVSAPACGLFLTEVKYPLELFKR
jgi:tRNA pseudouridine38-40 synthase